MFFQCNMSMQVIVHRTESDWTANGIRLGGERKRWQNERNHSTKQGAVVSVSL